MPVTPWACCNVAPVQPDESVCLQPVAPLAFRARVTSSLYLQHGQHSPHILRAALVWPFHATAWQRVHSAPRTGSSRCQQPGPLYIMCLAQ